MYPGTWAATTPDKAAVVMADDGETLTFAQLHDEATRLANAFRARGLSPGDHVAICLENQARLFSVVYGAQYAGLYFTMVGTRLTVDEMAYIVADCGARAVVTSADLGGVVAEAVAENLGVRMRVVLDGSLAGFESYDALLAAADATPVEGPEGQDFFYSSGTTGQPKGVKVPLSGRSVGDPDPAVALCQRLFGVDTETIYLSPAPLYHAAPNRFCRAVIQSGGTAVVMRRFDAESFLAAIDRHRCTFSQVVPTMLVRMLKLPKSARIGYDLSSLNCLVHAAAPCPPEVKHRIIDWLGPVVHEFYGGTEANGFVYCTSEEWLAHPGTVGRAITGTLHVLDEDGDDVPAGEIGTVYFEGGGDFSYHNDEGKSLQALDPRGRGWSTLGDVGWLDEDGFLYLTDRRAHMIIVGGVNVYPQEAENVLTLHDAVLDVAVIGVPNEDTGEEVKAIVQLVAPGSETPELAEELITYCRARLAPIKCPRTVDFRAELPREPNGKLLKRLLKDEYWSTAGRRI